MARHRDTLMPKRKPGRPRKIPIVVPETTPKVSKREKWGDEATEKRFSGVQARALRELQRRVEDPVILSAMGVEDLGAVLKTCRENLVVIRGMSMGDGSGDLKMEVFSTMDMGEDDKDAVGKKGEDGIPEGHREEGGEF